jgi:hypothetical protein
MHDPSDWPDLPTDKGGIFVLCRAFKGGYWDGAEGWVDDWRVARQYPPAPWDGLIQAMAESDRLSAKGMSCVPMFIQRVGRAKFWRA